MRLKKVKAFIMVGVLAFTTMISVPSIANAEHTNPNNQMKCDNSYYSFTHTGFTGSAYGTGHRLTTGEYCTPVRLSYVHSKYCTSCNALLGSGMSFMCIEDHSVCPTYIDYHDQH